MKCLYTRWTLFVHRTAPSGWIQRHLAACSRCASLYAELTEIETALQSAPAPTLPPGWHDRLLAGLHAQTVPAQPHGGFREGIPLRKAAALAFAVLALAVAWPITGRYARTHRLARTLNRGNARLAELAGHLPATVASPMAREVDLLAGDLQLATRFLFRHVPLDHMLRGIGEQDTLP